MLITNVMVLEDDIIGHKLRIVSAFNMASARTSKNSPNSIGINDHISQLTTLAGIIRSFDSIDRIEGSVSKGYRERAAQLVEKTIGVYAHIRDKHGAQTVNDALELLARREISPDVVHLWIEEGFCAVFDLYEPLLRGYPEYKTELDKMREELKNSQ